MEKLTSSVLIVLFLTISSLALLVGANSYLTSNDPGLQGVLAPDFTLVDLEGNPFQLSAFQGRTVVVGFMATWCSQCKKQIPQYEAMWNQLPEIVLISVDIDPRESEEVLRAYAREFPNATWIWARDTANVGSAYNVWEVPTTVIINEQGHIMFEHAGLISASTIIAEVEQVHNS